VRLPLAGAALEGCGRGAWAVSFEARLLAPQDDGNGAGIKFADRSPPLRGGEGIAARAVDKFALMLFGVGYARGKANASMTSRTGKYTAGEVGRLRVIEDLLCLHPVISCRAKTM
jgi:hypothetical protein